MVGMMRRTEGSGRRALVTLAVVLVLSLASCRSRPPQQVPPPAGPPRAQEPTAIETGVSDVATGGSWEAGGKSGIYRVVVRSSGERAGRSDVSLQWLAWEARSEKPVEIRSVR